MTNEELHDFRKRIDACIETAEQNFGEISSAVKDQLLYSRAAELALTKLQEAKMWVGKCLEANGSPFPENLRDKA